MSAIFGGILGFFVAGYTGVLLAVSGVVGILLPLLLHWRPRLLGRRLPVGAILVLVGGFLLRMVVVLSSEGI